MLAEEVTDAQLVSSFVVSVATDMGDSGENRNPRIQRDDLGIQVPPNWHQWLDPKSADI